MCRMMALMESSSPKSLSSPTTTSGSMMPTAGGDGGEYDHGQQQDDERKAAEEQPGPCLGASAVHGKEKFSIQQLVASRRDDAQRSREHAEFGRRDAGEFAIGVNFFGHGGFDAQITAPHEFHFRHLPMLGPQHATKKKKQSRETGGTDKANIELAILVLGLGRNANAAAVGWAVGNGDQRRAFIPEHVPFRAVLPREQSNFLRSVGNDGDDCS